MREVFCHQLDERLIKEENGHNRGREDSRTDQGQFPVLVPQQ